VSSLDKNVDLMPIGSENVNIFAKNLAYLSLQIVYVYWKSIVTAVFNKNIVDIQTFQYKYIIYESHVWMDE